MKRLLAGLLLSSLLCSSAFAADKEAVKKLADEVGQATMKGDYAKVIDMTHPGLVKALGGREKAIQTAKDAMAQVAKQGITLKSFTTGDPEEFFVEGKNTFVVVPNSVVMNFPGGKLVGKSFLLGISDDDGKTWKFAEGSGLHDTKENEKSLPKFPAKLKLPAKEPPVITKDN